MVEQNPPEDEDSAERGGLYLAAFAAFTLPALIVLAAYLPSSPVSLAGGDDGDRVLDALEIDTSSVLTTTTTSSVLQLDAVALQNREDADREGTGADFEDRLELGTPTETGGSDAPDRTGALFSVETSPTTTSRVPTLVGVIPPPNGQVVPVTPISAAAVTPATSTTVASTPPTSDSTQAPSSTPDAQTTPTAAPTTAAPLVPIPAIPPVELAPIPPIEIAPIPPVVIDPIPPVEIAPIEPIVAVPKFSQAVEIGSIDAQVVRLRFASDIGASYRVTATANGNAAATVNGQAQAGKTEFVTLSGLQGGTAYNITVVLDNETSSGIVAVRTPGGQVALATDQVKILGLGTTATGRTWVQANYQSNICANGSFVIRDLAGNRVGSNAGQADGCTTQHLAVPGKWTAALLPGTSYDLTITVEANGSGLGGGNAQSTTIRIRTND